MYNNYLLIYKGMIMLDISLIMLGAGSSSRFALPVKKQWIRLNDTPLWLYATQNLCNFYPFKDVFIVSNECEYMSKFTNNFKFIKGGETRQDSLKNALDKINSEFVLVSDIARPCIRRELFLKLIEGLNNADCVVPALKVSDTVYFEEENINREKLKLIQTPQLSKTIMLKKALQSDIIYTDDSSAIKAVGGKIWYVEGNKDANKITYYEDLLNLNLPKPSSDIFSGNGFDVHKFNQNNDKTLVICGEKIPHEKGIIAHSDGDVGIHALIDAMLGAASLGDIGELFPDNNDKFKDISSIKLLDIVNTMIKKVGFEIINLDITIIAQEPKLSSYKNKMAKNIANTLNLTQNRVNIKATTTEHLGFIGKKEGIAALANVNLKFFDWTKYESFNSRK